MTHELRVGINMLQVQPYHELIRRAKKVDALGFDSLWLADHFGISPKNEGIWFDAWTLLAAIASETERVRIGPAVTSPTQHNPSMLAKRALTIDHISSGRLELAIGSGSGANASGEEKALGIKSDWTAAERVERFREFIEIVDEMLRTGNSNYQGDYYQLENAFMYHAPVQKPRPPLTIAALGSKSLKIAAQYADTWNTYGKGWVSPDECFAAAKRQIEMLDAHCEAIGRDPKEIRRSFYPFGPHPYGASMQAFYDFIEPYREIGFSEFILTWLPEEGFMGADPSMILKESLLEQIATEALPKLRAET